jgi:hypothetical protein
MRTRYKAIVILTCVYFLGSILLIGDDNWRDKDVAVALVSGLFCRAGESPGYAAYFRAGSGSVRLGPGK